MEGYNKVNYADLVELGFQKMDMEDRVHLKQYGYDYFILYYGECDDMLYLEWSPTDREVNVYIYGQTYRTGISLEEVKKIVKLLESEEE